MFPEVIAMLSPAVDAALFSSNLMESDIEESFASQSQTSNRAPFTATHLYFDQVERMRARKRTLETVVLADSNCFYVSSFSQSETTGLPAFARSQQTAKRDEVEPAWILFEADRRRDYLFQPQALKKHPAVVSLQAESTVERARQITRQAQSVASRLKEVTVPQKVDAELLRGLIEEKRRRQVQRVTLIMRSRHPELFPRNNAFHLFIRLWRAVTESSRLTESRLRVYFNDFRLLAGRVSR